MPSRPAPDPRRALQAGLAAYHAGRLEDAYRQLAPLRHAQAQNLAGICAQRLGRPEAAADAYARAGALAPTDPDIANNRGHFELARGAHAAAAGHFETALKASPAMVPARMGLAKLAAARGDWDDAASHWQAVTRARPDSREGRYGLATAWLERGDAEAAADLFAALKAEHDSPEIAFMLGRALLALGDLSGAETELAAAHARSPAAHSLRTLANLYWMQGETARFDRLVATAPAGLATTAIKLVLDTGDAARARQAWQDAYGAGEPDADGWTLAAQIARLAGDGTGAAAAAARALALDPHHAGALDTAAVAALMTGRPADALARLAPLKAAEPLAQNWIAHEAVAERLMADSRPGGLNDVDRFVRAYEIDLPTGFASLEAFNAALADTLRRLHVFEARPLDQSLRGNATQTARSLLDSTDPVIGAYIAALDGPIRRYLAEIGTGPDHPTTARNTGTYRFRGMWSVRLTGRGYHDSHVHPEGWISSAYYVAVPPGTAEAPDRAGWIGFGQPPYPTSPPLEPLKWVAPRPGQLVLFPSFMWHGTRPIAEAAERITAPFDLLPA